MTAARAAALAGCLYTAAASTCAAEPFDGRWAADARACASESATASLLRVNALSLRWGDAACLVRTSYRVRDAWHIDARCWGESAISSVAITLRMRGEHLVFGWAGARSEELWRCR